MRKTASITDAGSDVVMVLAPYGGETAPAALRQVAEASGSAPGSGFAVPCRSVVARLGVANHVAIAAAKAGIEATVRSFSADHESVRIGGRTLQPDGGLSAARPSVPA